MLITIKYTRPNIDVPWWTTIMTQELKDHYQTNYIDPGYLIEEKFVESEDKLVLTHTGLWDDQPLIISMFLSDPLIIEWKNIRELYCNSNNIIIDPAIMSYFDKDLNEEVTFIWQNP